MMTTEIENIGLGGSIRTIAIIAASLTLFGCKFFIPPQGHPVLDDRIGGGIFTQPKYVQFATTPERRVVLMNLNLETPHMCAEPSPDASEDLSYSLSAALSAKKTDTKVDASIAGALQSVSNQLFTRTQGVQFYRDGMFSLCMAYMNGVVNRQEDYIQLSTELRNQAFVLIQQEIPVMADIIKQKKSGTPPPAEKAAADASAAATAKESSKTTAPTPPATPTPPTAASAPTPTDTATTAAAKGAAAAAGIPEEASKTNPPK